MIVESYRPIRDIGGAGLHRGGCGIEKIYGLLAAGEVSIHDDREVVPPWGINGGLHGGTSNKWLHRAGAAAPERIPSKIDNLEVGPGDRVISRTAGSGSRGDPLDRPPAHVARDVRFGVVSAERARSDYGVALNGRTIDEAATAALRETMRAERGPAPPFEFGHRPWIGA